MKQPDQSTCRHRWVPYTRHKAKCQKCKKATPWLLLLEMKRLALSDNELRVMRTLLTYTRQRAYQVELDITSVLSSLAKVPSLRKRSR